MTSDPKLTHPFILSPLQPPPHSTCFVSLIAPVLAPLPPRLSLGAELQPPVVVVDVEQVLRRRPPLEPVAQLPRQFPHRPRPVLAQVLIVPRLHRQVRERAALLRGPRELLVAAHALVRPGGAVRAGLLLVGDVPPVYLARHGPDASEVGVGEGGDEVVLAPLAVDVHDRDGRVVGEVVRHALGEYAAELAEADDELDVSVLVKLLGRPGAGGGGGLGPPHDLGHVVVLLPDAGEDGLDYGIFLGAEVALEVQALHQPAGTRGFDGEDGGLRVQELDGQGVEAEVGPHVDVQFVPSQLRLQPP
eukprot:CAMPEP_0183294536 /NCGR_PEP_ID=MMETSP0160_2-20130417/2841_1 /TAXON_ID=2839 ORGANISM="Odontella Sinensis, Strain Grunow 1884" /NCGR_SAMPLE_ID=MMETSP0160_2 /ASSEMBLY_ACC=CAM_ASM_000250 /LENGTH=302 /DNA_ID=CAMNT_0025455881 /DNA_START=296 /DNA_END=1200 /DNA_ORIENTATION=-